MKARVLPASVRERLTGLAAFFHVYCSGLTSPVQSIRDKARQRKNNADAISAALEHIAVLEAERDSLVTLLQMAERDLEAWRVNCATMTAQAGESQAECVQLLAKLRRATEPTDAECEDLHLNEREEQHIEDWQNREREIGESLRRSRGFITLRSLRDLALVALLTLCAWACIIVLCGMSEVAR